MMLEKRHALLCLALATLLGSAFRQTAAQPAEPAREGNVSIEDRWYAWSRVGVATGVFHIRKTTNAATPDETVLDIEFVSEWRGMITSWDLQETCRNDQYLTPLRIVSNRHGLENFKAVVQWPEEGPGELVTTSGRMKGWLRLPRDTIGAAALFEIVRRLPFREGEVFAFHFLEEEKLNLKKDCKLTYKGKQRLAIGDEQADLHLFEQSGKGIRPCLYWLNDERQRIRVLVSGQEEFLAADDDEARARMAAMRARQTNAPSPTPGVGNPPLPSDTATSAAISPQPDPAEN